MNVRSQIQKVKKFIGDKFLDQLAKKQDGSLEEDMTVSLILISSRPYLQKSPYVIYIFEERPPNLARGLRTG
jgi:hypothetical protein